jgi:subfamily B ATP-binding cassette protein HlyB/CyaB
LRSHFGVVPQETVLFSGTIHDNLQMASPTASFEQIVAACKMAEIHDVIEAQPRGYQTRPSEPSNCPPENRPEPSFAVAW